jgi:hypothetical protein
MSDKDRKEFIDILQKYKVKLSKNKKASKKFLVDAGITTEKGNLKMTYKNLCIPQEQA